MFIVLNRQKAKDCGELSLWGDWAKNTNQPHKFRLCHPPDYNEIFYIAFHKRSLHSTEETSGYFPKRIFDLVKEDYKIEDFL